MKIVNGHNARLIVIGIRSEIADYYHMCHPEDLVGLKELGEYFEDMPEANLYMLVIDPKDIFHVYSVCLAPSNLTPLP